MVAKDLVSFYLPKKTICDIDIYHSPKFLEIQVKKRIKLETLE
jgi:hypothetical protein